MAYNRHNFLQKVVEVQNLVNEHKKFGATQTYIYKKYVRPRYFISKATFDRYMSIPAKMELKRYEKTQHKHDHND